MIIKCKMCGGDIQFNPGDTYGQCDHCGCTTTIPKADDEQKLNRYNRANHFRRQCEFDKAIAAYERILEEDDTDAEAHWGAALSRYGIEYVEDPATKKRIPTCHRARVESILADEDYLAAIEYAPDTISRNLYEEQAKEIAEIQKGILAISANEEPYDVFICYKETDDNGQRTRDSALAQEIYYGLTEEGYKVFFSRITLEDKLGKQYEPYIFAALNSARVMVVIGTKPEYLNAVWVKNEWSRYLHLMKNDRKRLLIPCYRDMDPYDLPEELGNLQSQDMNRIGFMQDLLRGIRKVLEAEREKDKPVIAQQATQDNSSKVNALLDRAFLSIEDGEFSKADEFCEQALNMDPRNSRAYLGKLMIERSVKTQAALSEGKTPLEGSTAYQRALRFANPEQKQQLEAWNQEILDRNEHERKALIRDKALANLDQAKTIGQCEAVKNELATIKGFEGVQEAISACDERIEQINSNYYEQAQRLLSEGSYVQAQEQFERLGDYRDSKTMAIEARYQKALAAMDKGEFVSASSQFKALGDYRDSDDRAQICLEREEERKRKEAADRAERQRLEEERKAKEAAEKAKKVAEEEERKRQEALIAKRREEEIKEKARRRNIILTLCAVVAAAGVAVYILVIAPMLKYNQAMQALEEKNYTKAVALFEEIQDYKDSKQRVKQAQANEQFDLGNYDNVGNIYASLDDQYQDHAADFTQMYEEAGGLLTGGEYDKAIDAFTKLGNYKDSADQIKESKYQKAVSLMSNDRENAVNIFKTIQDYKDCATLLIKCEADKLFDDGDYAGAWEKYSDIDVSYHSHDEEYALMYEKATKLQTENKYDSAIKAFSSLGKYGDSSEKVKEITYQKAKSLYESKDYDVAIALLMSLNYKDSEKVKNQIVADRQFDAGDYAGAWEIYSGLDNTYHTHDDEYVSMYEAAETLRSEGKYDEASKAFSALGKYSDASDQVVETDYQKAKSLYALKDYDGAIKILSSLNYKDSATLIKQITADQKYDTGDYAGAWEVYSELDDAYSSHKEDYALMYATASEAFEQKDYNTAYDTFRSLGSYSDAATQAGLVGIQQAEDLVVAEKYSEAAEVYTFIGDKEKAIFYTYQFAQQQAGAGEYKAAADAYGTILDYEDSREQRYQMGLKLRIDGKLQETWDVLSQDLEYRDAKDAAYQTAVDASAEKLYEVSVPAFTALGTFKDCAMKLTMDTYAWGRMLFDQNEYIHAAEVFESMGSFSDAQEKAKKARYSAAKEAYDNSKFEEAAAMFGALGNYEDSETWSKKSQYSQATDLMENGKYENARILFESLGDFEDSAEKVKECIYRPAKALMADGKYQEALPVFVELADYSDSSNQVKECEYQLARLEMTKGNYLDAATAFDALENYSDSKTMASKCRYSQAQIEQKAGNIKEAIALYQLLGNYSDSKAQFESCYYDLAVQEEEKTNYAEAYELYLEAGSHDNAKDKAIEMAYLTGTQYTSSGEYELAIDWFGKARKYKDSEDQIINVAEYYYSTSQYELAEQAYSKLPDNETAQKRLYELGQYYDLVGNAVKAYNAYRQAGDYLDASEKAEAARVKIYSVGDYVVFGQYPQNKDGSDLTPIEWLVLSVENNRMLLISKDSIDAKPYSSTWGDVAVWETSTLRSWLNREFIGTAFTEEQQRAILTTQVSNEKGEGFPEYNTSGGNDTQDKVFILSYNEAFNLYFSNDVSRKAAITEYAKAQGSIRMDDQSWWWWLRSPGNSEKTAIIVEKDGTIICFNVNRENIGVRPVIWVDLNSGLI